MEVVGGIYSLQPLPSRWLSMAHRTGWWCTGHGTVHCPVRATSATRWGLERLTVEVLCLLPAPDSPVAHRTCPVRSDFAALTFDFCAVHFYCLRSRLLSAGDCCSIVSPDMSGAHRTLSGAPLAAPLLVFASNLIESPT
jgi:hypothetical protein